MFKIALFDNSNPEDLLLFVLNFKMTIGDLGMITASAKLQYHFTLLCGEALRYFDTFCDQLGSTNTAHVRPIVLGVGTYSLPFNALSKQK